MIPLEITAIAPNGAVISDEERLFFMTSRRVPVAPDVDGDLWDWPEAEPIVLNRREQLISEWRKWEGPEDASALVYTCWDDDNFYIAAEVVDDDVSAP